MMSTALVVALIVGTSERVEHRSALRGVVQGRVLLILTAQPAVREGGVRVQFSLCDETEEGRRAEEGAMLCELGCRGNAGAWRTVGWVLDDDRRLGGRAPGGDGESNGAGEKLV